MLTKTINKDGDIRYFEIKQPKNTGYLVGTFRKNEYWQPFQRKWAIKVCSVVGKISMWVMIRVSILGNK